MISFSFKDTLFHDIVSRKVETVVVPDTVTRIGDHAFNSCSALKSADLIAVTELGTGAFGYCTSLISLLLRSETMCSYDGYLQSSSIESGSGYVYVPAALVDTYKAASGWKNHANQFRALEDYTVDGTITGALDPNKTGA